MHMHNAARRSSFGCICGNWKTVAFKPYSTQHQMFFWGTSCTCMCSTIILSGRKCSMLMFNCSTCALGKSFRQPKRGRITSSVYILCWSKLKAQVQNFEGCGYVAAETLKAADMLASSGTIWDSLSMFPVHNNIS